MSCCRKIKAHVGYTQDEEWYVVMVSHDRIVCECHSHQAGFHIRSPFSLEQWQHQWEQCEEKFFHGQNIHVEWEQHVLDVLLDKTSKVVKGTVYQRIS
jgi:hypothetical protein